MISRKIEKELKLAFESMSVVTLTGPRQSGKTTLAKKSFPMYTYFNLERPDTRDKALNDPLNFLRPQVEGLIIDEAQHAPDLFSYIQAIVDENPERKFLLTGSQNFLLSNKISQSLAGRTRILVLLPLSIEELKEAGHFYSLSTHIWKGAYPKIYKSKINTRKWLLDYIQTYVERDVRQILNIKEINQFQAFLKLCAGRIGQTVNYTSLSNDVGVSDKTIRSWISILEASYILYRLSPYYRNFGKRVTKSPKIYFYDTGLASMLLGITSHEQVFGHYLQGGLFENWVISEFVKKYTNKGESPSLYYWREGNRREIDLLLEEKGKLTPIEIKSSRTMYTKFFNNIKYFNNQYPQITNPGYVIYGGGESMQKTLSWSNLNI